MGNCLIRNNQISAQDDDYDDNYVELQHRESELVDQQKKTITTSGSSSFESEEAVAAMPEESMKKKKKIKKKVRFELQKDEEEGREEIRRRRRRSGSVRIKLVMTQEELRRILSQENGAQHTTLEQLLSSVKLRGSRRICEVGEDDNRAINAWRPTLETIPEDQ